MTFSLKESIYNAKKKVTQPYKTICEICEYKDYKYAPLIPDKLFLKCFYRKHLNKKLNLKNPQTFNEKLQWLKLYDRKPIYTTMVDKATMKDYVSNVIGDGYEIKTIGIYKNVEEIPFDQLPDKYVVKCTHDSGSAFICRDKSKINLESLKHRITEKLKKNYYWYGREWCYKRVVPRIIVEEYLDDNGKDLLDYKLFCFNGQVKLYDIHFNRFGNHKTNLYNINGDLLNFEFENMPSDPDIIAKRPDKFSEMVTIAEILSKDIPFLRVDFYSVNNRIYVGELTFYPSSGVQGFTNSGDNILGRMLELPKKQKGERFI